MTTKLTPSIEAAKKVSGSSALTLPYFNRELSWLAFNRRVLNQAESGDYPILERVRFLAFVSSNLDEFFEIRVAGLMQQVDSGVQEKSMDGLGPREVLRRIHNIVSRLVLDQYKCWREQVTPELAREGIHFKATEDLTKREQSDLEKIFHDEILPVLTPLAVDPAHPFPDVINKILNILVWLEEPKDKGGKTCMAIIPVPRILPRIIEVENDIDDHRTFLFLSDVVKLFAESLFPGYTVKAAQAFRVTRNSDLYIDEEEVENLLKTIEEELHRMRKGAAVRLEIEHTVTDEQLDRLLKALRLTQREVFRIPGPINLLRLMGLPDMVDRPELKFPAFVPHTPPELSDPENIFKALREQDYFLHHPFDSFQSVVDFIRQAARDPEVLSIKQTLYRTGGDSVVNALIEASDAGKQVTALIELKARFDEANNIHWARRLKESGVHVVYGLVGLKTHCKCCLVVRREKDGLIRYAHLGTGNYNPKTGRLYTDFSYMTARPELTADTATLFNTLTGFSHKPEFKHLLVAPFNLHRGIVQRIRAEAENAEAGKPSRIIIKVNSLIDREVIDELYKAAQAGVKVDLIVRGICGIVPGLSGLSEKIRVRSVLGRYLEHSRAYYFENAGDPLVYMGSADWMPRNFYRRIEAAFPILDVRIKHEVTDILELYLKDEKGSRLLRSNGAYYRLPRSKDQEPLSAQALLAEQAMAKKKTTVAPVKAADLKP